MTFFVTFPPSLPRWNLSMFDLQIGGQCSKYSILPKKGETVFMYGKEVAEIEHLIHKQVKYSFDGLGRRKPELVEIKAT
jgi:hypothetical protein